MPPEEVKTQGKRGWKMTDEHKAKIRAGRVAYLAKKKLLASGQPVWDAAGNQIEAESSMLVDLKPAKNIIENARENVVKKIFKKHDKILEAQIDAASGLYYLTNDGKHVYTQRPDKAAGEYLLNQLIGKPKESIEIKSINLNVDL